MDVLKDASSFVKQVIARINGDGAAEIAAANERKGRAAINQQISNLESQQVDAEEKLSDAKVAFEDAVYAKHKITNNQAYAQNISDAQFNVESAESKLAEVSKSLSFYKNLLKERF